MWKLSMPGVTADQRMFDYLHTMVHMLPPVCRHKHIKIVAPLAQPVSQYVGLPGQFALGREIGCVSQVFPCNIACFVYITHTMYYLPEHSRNKSSRQLLSLEIIKCATLVSSVPKKLGLSTTLQGHICNYFSRPLACNTYRQQNQYLNPSVCNRETSQPTRFSSDHVPQAVCARFLKVLLKISPTAYLHFWVPKYL